jgi:hypothetical protein
VRASRLEAINIRVTSISDGEYEGDEHHSKGSEAIGSHHHLKNRLFADVQTRDWNHNRRINTNFNIITTTRRKSTT